MCASHSELIIYCFALLLKLLSYFQIGLSNMSAGAQPEMLSGASFELTDSDELFHPAVHSAELLLLPQFHSNWRDAALPCLMEAVQVLHLFCHLKFGETMYRFKTPHFSLNVNPVKSVNVILKKMVKRSERLYVYIIPGIIGARINPAENGCSRCVAAYGTYGNSMQLTVPLDGVVFHNISAFYFISRQYILIHSGPSNAWQSCLDLMHLCLKPTSLEAAVKKLVDERSFN